MITRKKANNAMTEGMATGMGPKRKRKANTPKEPAAPPPGNIGPAVTPEQKEDMQNKYAPKPKVGAPTLKRTTYVTTVGLGNLEVRTADGTTNT